MGDLPTLANLLDALSFLGKEPAAIGVLATSLLLIVGRDWRWSLLILSVQYVLAGWLLTGVLEPQVAVLKILVGVMICLVLYLTARQVQWNSSSSDREQRSNPRARLVSSGLIFRLLVSLVAAVAIYQLYRRGINLPLLEMPSHIVLATISLAAMGLLALGLTEEPLRAGIGLLTVITGFELFYHSLEQGLTVIAFLVGIDFLIGIVTAYLTIAHNLSPEEAEQGGRT